MIILVYYAKQVKHDPKLSMRVGYEAGGLVCKKWKSWGRFAEQSRVGRGGSAEESGLTNSNSLRRGRVEVCISHQSQPGWLSVVTWYWYTGILLTNRQCTVISSVYILQCSNMAGYRPGLQPVIALIAFIGESNTLFIYLFTGYREH